MKIVKEFDLEASMMVSEIVDIMGINIDKESISNNINTSKLENKKDAASLGKEVAVSIIADLGIKIISKLYKAKKEVYIFAAYMYDITEEEAKKLKFKDIKELFTTAMETEGMESFLERAEEQTEK